MAQRAPFTPPQSHLEPALAEEVYLTVRRTAELLERGLAEALRAADVTPTQYSALRILREAGPGGMASGDVGEQMVTRDPDVTRLLDRMERRGWVRREREPGDRRVVRAWLTEQGKALTDSLDAQVAQVHLRQVGHLGRQRIEELLALLAQLRLVPSSTPRLS